MKRIWNRTKIVATIGPASSKRNVFNKMLLSGMDVARINFSHGTREEHERSIKMLREVSGELPVAILADLQGPRIRIGKFRAGKAELKNGQKFRITIRDITGDESVVSTSYKNIVKDVNKGDIILLSDGKIELVVKNKNHDSVLTEVLTGGILSDNKGINIPNISLSIKTITQKDIKDAQFAVDMDADYIAVSFVRTKEDIMNVRQIVNKCGKQIPLISKIEQREAVNNLDSIMEVSDGIMVARGDLGVEFPPEDVPILQKKIIKRANEQGIPVITATQMLASMTDSIRPTRAEASDVANAILDGTDAVMLSEETAVGLYPVESVLMMSKIAENVENELPFYRTGKSGDVFIAEAVSKLSYDVHAKWICCFTRSGKTALAVSKNRPRVPVLGLTSSIETFRRMNLYYGVEPLLIKEVDDMAEMTGLINSLLKEKQKVRKGDKVLIVSSFPFYPAPISNKKSDDVSHLYWCRMNSNMMLVHEII